MAPLFFPVEKSPSTISSSDDQGRMTMPTGKVKWFNRTKGYGFIQPDEGGSDVFVHISAVEAAGMGDLQENQALNYELATTKGRVAATNLKSA
jgi:CspA family cold shock protein